MDLLVCLDLNWIQVRLYPMVYFINSHILKVHYSD